MSKGSRIRRVAAASASLVVGGLVLAHGAKPAVVESMTQSRLPLAFEKNVGQTDRRVDFVARGAGTTAWIAGRETVFAFAADGGAQDVLRMQVVGANTPVAEGRSPLSGTSNYLRSAGAVVGAPHFAEVVEKGVLPGVDLRWHAERSRLEYDLVLAPNADASSVRVEMKGADSLTLRDDGSLAVRVGAREIVQSAPLAWQTRDGVREPVAAAFDVRGNEVGFRVGAHDAARELVVDPTLDFSTYLGGSGDETGNGVAVDGGATYVCGGTTSIDFPLGFGHIPTAPKGLTDAYVAKVDPSGAFVQWATYLAGRDYDEAFGIAVDPASHAVWVCGQTFSDNFPTMQPTQASRAGGWDGFLAELSGTGDQLLFSTYLGGTRDDFARGVSIGSVVSVAGFTSSQNFPTVNATQPAFGGGQWDAFLASWSKTNPAAGLTQSTYLGGQGDDRGYAVASFAGRLVAGAPGTVDVVTNGGFENGGGSFNSWNTADTTAAGGTPPFEPLSVRANGYTFASPASPWPYPAQATYPFFATTSTDGTHAAVSGFGMGSNAGTITMDQDVFIPPTSDDGLLSFDWRAGWFFFGAQDRKFEVQVIPQSGPTSTVYSQTFLHSSIGANGPSVDFDSLPTGFPPSPGYGGILWNNADWTVGPSTFFNVANSPPNGVYTTAPSAQFNFAVPVVFDGAWMSALIPETRRWDLYYGGVLVAQSASQASTQVPAFLPTGYTGPVDEVHLTVVGAPASGVLMDDFAYRFITNPGTRDTGNVSPSLPIDLTDYAGHTIRVRFKLTVPETDTGPAQFQLDHVQFLAAKGHVVVAGRTTSPDFPHKNKYNDIDHTVQDAQGGSADAFAVAYTRSGRKVRWATTLGGAGDDEARGVSVVSNGDVALCGATDSFNFPVVVPFQQRRHGPDDAWVAKILNGAAILDFSTYLGGGGSDRANGVVLSEQTGDVYVVGTTGSTDFPVTSDAQQTPLVGGMDSDAFVARFGTIVNSFSIAQPGLLKYASGLGGTGYDSGNALAVASGSTLHVVGTTKSSAGFPMVGALQPAMSGASDAFVAKTTVSSVLYPAGDLSVEARAPDVLALSWKPQAPDASALRIERTSDAGVTTEIATVSPNASQFVDTGLAADTNYSYAVVALHDDGTTTSSNSVAGTTLPYPPASPADLIASVAGASVSLSWTDMSMNETGFEIQKSTNGEFQTIARVPANSTHWEKTEIAAGDANWRVVAVNRGGSSSPSNEVAASTSSTLALAIASGSLLDAKASGADRFTVSGRVDGASAFDPNVSATRIEFGSAKNPIVLEIPAASRGWTSKRGVLSFSSTKGFLGGARFTFVLDQKRGAFSLTVSGFDFPAASADVSVGIALGSDAGRATSTWKSAGAGRFSAK